MAESPKPRDNQAPLILPDAPVVTAGFSRAAWLSADGEIEMIGLRTAAERAGRAMPLVCHRPFVARRLGLKDLRAYDLLELFAFVRPAAFAVPTPGGLAAALGLARPKGLEAEASSLRNVALALLRELATRREDDEALGIAWTMAEAGWPWGPPVLQALGFAEGQGAAPRRAAGYDVWARLPDWHEDGPPPPPGNRPVEPTAARRRLAELLDEEAEARPEQADYASAVSQAFGPRENADSPRLVLAEAGTGIGKTLGYIAPASLWSEVNEAPIWISTYTRNLQSQIDDELSRLYPVPAEKAEKVVIRKGRENYLCLLNYEEAVRAMALNPTAAVALGLMARWLARSRDGDMVGGDFPGWLSGLLGRAATLGLTDRRGECIYSACAHYGKCFIERSQRRAKHAAIVVANHALVMIRAAQGGEEGQLPSHYVFDEGHHIFDAADSAFAAHLSGREGFELRRWLIGAEARGRGNGRNRGLRRRSEDLLAGDETGSQALEQALAAAAALPGEGWRARLMEGRPRGPCEAFLALLRQQVLARNAGDSAGYGLECQTQPLWEGLDDAARGLADALARIEMPLSALRKKLLESLDEEAGELEAETRRRIDALARGIQRRALMPLAAWRRMLAELEAETPPEFCDWFALERVERQEVDVGMFRHWIDPTGPFAETLLASAQGAVITSATLTDGSGDQQADWTGAEARSGAAHLPVPALRSRLASPFDYPAQTRVFLVRDLPRGDLKQLASAYRELFLAAGGGCLGLFTAISRLRAVQAGIAPALDEAGLPLLSQHIDGMDTATLVEIFRAEEDSCLLGTDAVRDGVDVPGRSLRLIAFDRVPWPRPDLRHKARRARFGGRHYDDQLARLKLKQAYGRLIRRRDDKGVFVVLDPAMPSRLTGAFPPGVAAERVGLAEAVAGAREFLAGESRQD